MHRSYIYPLIFVGTVFNMYIALQYLTTIHSQIGLSQLESKHNLHNIFNQIYKLLYIRQIKFCYFSVTATEILSILFRLTQLRLKFILGKQTSQSGQ